jgi:hypothetical protein
MDHREEQGNRELVINLYFLGPLSKVGFLVFLKKNNASREGRR